MFNHKVSATWFQVNAASSAYNAAMSGWGGRTSYKTLHAFVFRHYGEENIDSIETMNVCIDAGLEAAGDHRFRGSIVQACCHLAGDEYSLNALENWLIAIKQGGKPL